MALRVVMTNSTCHRSSRSSNRGNRPAATALQKLSKAESATSSSSAAPRGTKRSRARASATSRAKYTSHSGCAAAGSPAINFFSQIVIDLPGACWSISVLESPRGRGPPPNPRTRGSSQLPTQSVHDTRSNTNQRLLAHRPVKRRLGSTVTAGISSKFCQLPEHCSSRADRAARKRASRSRPDVPIAPGRDWRTDPAHRELANYQVAIWKVTDRSVRTAAHPHT